MRYALYSTLLVFSFAGAVIWATPEREFGNERTIREQVASTPANERAQVKAREIAKIDHRGTFERENYRIEITDLQEIEGGVEVFVRAWKNGQQIGFGKDGSVDVERFRVFNPPVLVPDPTGEVVVEVTEGLSRNATTRPQRFREDPQEAILQVIEHNLSVMKNVHDSSRIAPGKVGRTTSTFFSEGNAETNVWDGELLETTDAVWATIIAAAGDTADDLNNPDIFVQAQHSGSGSNWANVRRSAVGFYDVGDIGTDEISSATITRFGSTKGNDTGQSYDINVFGFNPASDTAGTASDYGVIGSNTTAFSTTITYASFAVSNGANDWALNASGITHLETAVAGDGKAWFGFKSETYDNGGVEPFTSLDGEEIIMRGYYSEQTGTSLDPKLVVEHAPAAAEATPVQDVIFFE